MLWTHAEHDGARYGHALEHRQRRRTHRQPRRSIGAHGDAITNAAECPGHEVHRRAAEKSGHERVRRSLVDALGRVHLAHATLMHDDDPVAERHCLDLIMRHVEHRGAQTAVQLGKLAPHFAAQGCVEVRERLVEQEHARLTHDGPADRHPLPLSTRQLARLAVEKQREAERRGGLVDARVDLARRALAKAQGKAHVLAHRHVRIQRIALKDHGNVPLRRWHVVHDPSADGEPARSDRLQSRNHPECRALAAPGWADQHDELAGGDGEIHPVHGDDASIILLAYGLQLDRRGCLRCGCHVTLSVLRLSSLADAMLFRIA